MVCVSSVGICWICYLAKPFLFPMAFVFLAMLIATSGRSLRQRSPRIALALLAFMVIALPEIALLSHSKDALLFQTPENSTLPGSTTIFRTETGEATRQAPARPFIPRENSLIIPRYNEFNGPLRSSYPPWFDPDLLERTDCPQRLGSEP